MILWMLVKEKRVSMLALYKMFNNYVVLVDILFVMISETDIATFAQ